MSAPVLATVFLTRQAWKPGDEMKSLTECLHSLARCAGGDGNLLLNVGPMPDGRIEARQVERLEAMGAWLARYGESVYGTRGGPWKPTRAIASTRKDNLVFLHLLGWDGQSIVLPDLTRQVTHASVLGGTSIEVRQANGKLVVTVPASQRGPVDTVVRLEFDL